MEEHLDLFSKAELIEGFQGIPDVYRERLIRNMFYEKQCLLLKAMDLNVAERRKLSDKLKNTPKQKWIDVWVKIHENDKEYNKLQKQLDKLDKIMFGGE